jgi:F0F1-type ATP synthase assembly protein I
MQGDYCPPLWSVAAYGFSAFLSLVMIGFLLNFLFSRITWTYAPVGIIMLFTLGIVIVLSVFRFAKCHQPR